MAAGPGAWPGPHVYNDTYTGWPVAPVDEQHPIRASFHDIRPGSFPKGLPGYHIGIDIAVRDDQPEAGAPPARSHRVYAVEGGTVDLLPNVANVGCVNRRVTAGHFSYWHVDPVGVVSDGQVIAPGQFIGWTCTTLWHVHLSEIQNVAGVDEWVNPLHPDGKLAPYVDTAPPAIEDVALYAPADPAWQLDGTALWSPDAGTRVDPAHVSGPVDLRATIPDRQSFAGWLAERPELAADLHPYRVRVQLIRLADGLLVLDRDAFQADTYLAQPFDWHYAPGARQNLPAQQCLDTQPANCNGTMRFRLFATIASPYLDTTTLPNGAYRLALTAWDTQGNESPTATLDLAIDNPVPAALPPTAPPPPTPPPRDTRAPVVGIRLEPTVRLGRALRQGLRVLATCSEPCRLRVAVRLGPRAARRLGVAPTRTLAVVELKRMAAGRRVAVLRFPPRSGRCCDGPASSTAS